MIKLNDDINSYDVIDSTDTNYSIHCKNCNHCERCINCGNCEHLYNCRHCTNIGYIGGEMKNKYMLKNAKNIHNYNSSKEYYVLYDLLAWEDKVRFHKLYHKIISETPEGTYYDFTDLSGKGFCVSDPDNPTYYLLIKEIVEILINECEFPIKLFPNEIIESIKSNILEKE